VIAVKKGGDEMNGDGFGARCSKCGTYIEMTSPANDWGCHNICSKCGYTEELEELEAKDKVKDKQHHLQ
jgi:DNA-directed RNA polymerase subunit M/transcription elongation factor TFIIS